jgi:SpoVK/Ycf46/Vps4 family AAA+-type ATPase
MSKWYGESESMIEQLFKAVKERKPCILFLDEIDAIAKRRDFYSADDVTPRLLSIMLSELDGMDEAAGVIVVGATNKPELVDPALMRPGRFDKVIFIPAPEYRSRVDIFKIHLKNKPVSPNLDIEHLARSTEGFTGADIENLVKEAAMLAMKRSIRTRQDTKISNNDFIKILPRIKPSMTTDMKEEYARLQIDFERKKYGKEIKLPPTEQPEPSKAEKGRKRKKRPSGRTRETRKGRERRRDGTKPATGTSWGEVVGLDSSKRFFKGTIENNLKGGK